MSPEQSTLINTSGLIASSSQETGEGFQLINTPQVFPVGTLGTMIKYTGRSKPIETSERDK